MTSNELTTMRDSIEYAKTLSVSRLLPEAYVNKPENVLVAIEYGKALGIPPIQAINSVNVIQGKPTMSADLMAALVRRAGCKLRILQDGTGREATVKAQLIRPDDPDYTFEVSWDWKRAERAGIVQGRNGVKTNWDAYPEQMLRSRAITEVCRTGANDFLMGVIYAPEELGGGQPATHLPAAGGVTRVDIVDDTPADTSLASPSEVSATATDEAIATIYDLAESLGYEPERLAAGVAWASNQRTQTVEDLTGEEAEQLGKQMLAMADSSEAGDDE